jgi:phosphomannomutase
MSASPVGTDSRGAVGRYFDRALLEDEAEAVDQFVARVLRRAHHSAEARNAPSEARAILEVAHLFADEWIASDPDFDRLGFVEAATEGPS